MKISEALKQIKKRKRTISQYEFIKKKRIEFTKSLLGFKIIETIYYCNNGEVHISSNIYYVKPVPKDVVSCK